MKNILNSKVVLILIVALVCITVLSTIVNATDSNGLNLITDPNATNTNKVTNNNQNSNLNNNLNSNTNNNINSNTSSYNNTNTTLPQTGIEDFSLWIIIPICLASAIYAYKKIRDYNV